MSKSMLIDASHEEETRVVIVENGRVQDLDFESAAKRQLRGNVYLARITRVEPSLQAAFVEFGGNRHGFLAFPEIHPDYYQIPHEDRVALQEEEARIAAEVEDDDEVEEDENLDPDADDASDENDAEVAEEQVKVASTRRKRINRRRYKIQEVIKRGQILLVQAVKEERGNKGAALTTYLSLAGRHSVLMPNTPRGGGISRKISSATDRKRLKKIVDGFDVPNGMGVIVRTAGAKKTKAEIKRDYDYLMKLWDDIRDTTMKSHAPALVHEEGNLVKRSLRDLYSKDIDEVVIAGSDSYKVAKSFIKLLMPSHASKIKEHKGDLPLFLEYGVEKQIEASLDSVVQLKSGGYLVIHPTEALVSVDVNSGRSTKERNVERTALKTNLEAADEVARQMRLRDLAGLIVIDFIDMDETKNNRAVEKRMKEALSSDRARVQWGKISQFGLMEISRQRRRRSLLEASTAVCRHCDGVGRKRTVESSALKAIRALEEVAARGQAGKVSLKAANDVAHYIVNTKRDDLVDIENRLGTFTEVVADEEMIRPDYEIDTLEKRKGRDRLKEAEAERRKRDAEADKARAKQAREEAEDDEDETDEADADSEATDESSDDKPRSRSRRRGRRGGRSRRRKSEDSAEDTAEDAVEDATDANASDDEATEEPKPKRRRRRAPARKADAEAADDSGDEDEAESGTDDGAEEAKPKSTRRRRAPGRSKAGASSDAADAGEVDAGESAEGASTDAPAEDAKPKRARRKAPARAAKASAAMVEAEDVAADTVEDAPEDAPKPRRGRRKAPARAEAPAETVAEEATEEAVADAKPKRARRKAPAKSATKSAAKAKAADTATEAESAAPEAAVEAEAAPAKTRTRRKAPARKSVPGKSAPRKAAASEEPEVADAADGEADATAAPKRRRRAPARKAAEATQAAVQSEASPEDIAGTADAEPEAKPARKASARKAPARKAKSAEAEAETAAPALEEAIDKAPAKGVPAKKTPAKKAPARRRAAAKPKAKAGKTADAAKDTSDDAPKKRGWWNLGRK